MAYVTRYDEEKPRGAQSVQNELIGEKNREYEDGKTVDIAICCGFESGGSNASAIISEAKPPGCFQLSLLSRE